MGTRYNQGYHVHLRIGGFAVSPAAVPEQLMLTRLAIKNLTVFADADLHFGRNVNVIVGENGSGKTHLLKIAYTSLAVSAELGLRKSDNPPTKAAVQVRMAEKLVNVFRPEKLGRLVRRNQSGKRCSVAVELDNREMNLSFNFASSDQEVDLETMPTGWLSKRPAYLPTRELLTIYPNFVSVYENHYLDFEETWRDTCVLLGGLVMRGEHVADILKPLEDAMGGKIVLDDKAGRFYLMVDDERLEMPLVAEGMRKLGMLARLVTTGTLLRDGYLFWDEPEANLNPRLIKQVAKSILALSVTGSQVFIATHSLFLLRELEILIAAPEYRTLDARFFGLHLRKNGVSVEQGKTVDDIGDIAALDEELTQSDRYVKEDV